MSPQAVIAQGRTAPSIGLFQVVLLAALMGLTSLSTDVYLPAMPQMRMDLRGDVELTITGFLIGFAIAQLAWGPISDRIGRRRPLLIGTALFVLGSIMCALSESITQIILWRVVQALGACTGPMLARTMVRDLYQRADAARMLSTLTLIMAAAPIIGPLLGGQILRWSSWHAIFWVLTVLGAVLLVALRWLPETHPVERRVQTPLTAAFKDYLMLLRNGRFIRPTLAVMFFYMAVYAFIAGSPDVYIGHFGVASQHYGLLFGVNIVGVMLLSVVNRKLVNHFPLDVLLRASTIVATVSIVVAVSLMLLGVDTLIAVAAPIFVFMSMNGIVAASATAAALDEVPNLAGSASALLGALQYGSGIVPTALLAWHADGSPTAMLWIMAATSVVSCGVAMIRPASSSTSDALQTSLNNREVA